ncbi:glycosyl hydrolase family 95 catalytic domain-containing protein [Paenibacillus cymbidii]|uniref:glycosyl hydrolase family 95 catalytic domain-containing protein n=1 Tax=Paenibacillus cymbidii TaxID=1639034 RepID=UPI001081017E|nr:glycoside hydrolase N-terminal domain-containing protein [Paenibacillus cymbidii]
MSYKMVMNRPAAWWNDTWREGTPIGNGWHGGLVYGAAAYERIMLTHTAMWREVRQPELPDVSYVLPKMRERIFEGRVQEGDPLIADELKKQGYAPDGGYPFPAADLHIKLPANEGFSKYRRELLMDSAEATVRFCDGKELVFRRAFVSRADDVLVVEANAGVEVDLTVHLPDTVDSTRVELPKRAVTQKEGEWIYFKAEIDSIEHGAVARVVRGARTLIICRLFTEGDSRIKWRELTEYMEQLPADYNELLRRHQPEHSRLFGTCRFQLDDNSYSGEELNRTLLDAAYDGELPNALVERMWAYGRYLLTCGTSTGGLPCNLTGLWSGEYRAFWAFNMANINLEMIYWQVLPARMTELLLPVFDYYERNMEDMRENARKLYGCRGIYLPAVSTPGGLKIDCISSHIINWIGGAGWIAQHYYEYWAFTRDHDFLVNRALPFLREAAAFYEDFLIWQDDKWLVAPSISPENHCSSYRGGEEAGEMIQTSINATMDVAIIKEVFAHLIELGGLAGAADEELAVWKTFLAGTPEYERNEAGAPREWLHEDFADRDIHRHQSHLYPVFPGLELARAGEDILESYRIGGIRRMTLGLAYQTSWGLAQNASLLARVGDAEHAWKCLSLISRSTLMENLLTVHNDWRDMGIGLRMKRAPFQIDANMGWTAAVQEMLLFSNRNRIDILPALPAQWERGSIGPLATRAGAEVSITWDLKANGGKAKLTAVRHTEFNLHLPDRKVVNMVLLAHQAMSIAFSFSSS